MSIKLKNKGINKNTQIKLKTIVSYKNKCLVINVVDNLI